MTQMTREEIRTELRLDRGYDPFPPPNPRLYKRPTQQAHGRIHIRAAPPRTSAGRRSLDRGGTIHAIVPVAGIGDRGQVLAIHEPFMRRRLPRPYRFPSRFNPFRSRRPISRHFSWQHTPTFNQVQQKQSREVALCVHENQMTTAHLSGGGEYLLNGVARRPHRHKVCLVNHAGQSTPGVYRANELRCGFSSKGINLSETSCVCRILRKESLRN
jgi:hypothetical protein